MRTHGFTREALSRSVLSLPEPHPTPLNETAVSALFGKGDDARRTLIEAWLSEGLADMKNAPSKSLKDILSQRLRYNEPVLGLLPEVIPFFTNNLRWVGYILTYPPVTGLRYACHTLGATSLGR